MKNLVVEISRACDNNDVTALRALVTPIIEVQRQYKALDIEAPSIPLPLESLNRVFVAAARIGRAAIVDLLLALGVSANAVWEGMSALMVASINGHAAVVDSLLKAGAVPDEMSEDNVTPLYMAARRGHYEVVILLCAASADPLKVVSSETEENENAFYAAIRFGHANIVSYLSTKILEGEPSPLVAAMYSLQPVAVVTKLLANGANPNADSHPLLVAVGKELTDVVAVMLRAGANAEINNGEALFRAIRSGNKKLIKILIRAGSENRFTHRDSDGNTVLHLAAKLGEVETVGLLLDHGANIDVETKDGETPLFVAAEHGNRAVVELLLQRKANINKAANEGGTPLCRAARKQHHHVVRLLLSAGADTEIADSTWTPLGWAVCLSNYEMVVDLLRAGANASVKDYHVYNPSLLHLCEDVRVMKKLLRAGADVIIDNATPINADTPLLRVCRLDNVGLMSVLLRWGADASLQNSAGETARQVVVRMGNSAAIAVFDLEDKLARVVESVKNSSRSMELWNLQRNEPAVFINWAREIILGERKNPFNRKQYRQFMACLYSITAETTELKETYQDLAVALLGESNPFTVLFSARSEGDSAEFMTQMLYDDLEQVGKNIPCIPDKKTITSSAAITQRSSTHPLRENYLNFLKAALVGDDWKTQLLTDPDYLMRFHVKLHNGDKYKVNRFIFELYVREVVENYQDEPDANKRNKMKKDIRAQLPVMEKVLKLTKEDQWLLSRKVYDVIYSVHQNDADIKHCLIRYGIYSRSWDRLLEASCSSKSAPRLGLNR